ncbi:Major Facilitator superfamily [Seminavis robusta]|uniref:Major Facilitator superfamily n=1 Tax=Seminavis robusta TaxID=568900 RepID=A0A9N8HL94_9STRA|nr:Major Facilitator superfamily [Seminavis robusta]|eukprot:Sro793_g203240.1 Major Facilitator superfamily (748) ;mRNA; f:21667-24041
MSKGESTTGAPESDDGEQVVKLLSPQRIHRRKPRMSSFLPQAVRADEDQPESEDLYHDDDGDGDDRDDEDDDEQEMADLTSTASMTPPTSPPLLNTNSNTYTAPLKSPAPTTTAKRFTPHYTVTMVLESISQRIMRSPHQYDPQEAATWIGFWALFLVTCSNYVLMPMRDAIALAVGVEHIPKLTLASTVLALFSSVPIGWLFEAPDPQRRRLWKRIGLTRGETQGTSLALFYRFFAMALWSYAIGFKGIEFLVLVNNNHAAAADNDENSSQWGMVVVIKLFLQHLGQAMYIAFFLVVHLMKLHSLSLVWGVTTEAMEYEETSRKRRIQQQQRQEQHTNGVHHHDDKSNNNNKAPTSKGRLQRLAFVGFGGTVGGILGSAIASSLARVFRLSGLLVFSALMLEAAAQLAIELGRIMHQHWTEQQLWSPSEEDLANASANADVDPSMKRSASLGSMKRISSGNSLSRVKSMSELKHKNNNTNLQQLAAQQQQQQEQLQQQQEQSAAEDSFSQRLFRGIRTILQSRLLMAIFTYNALFASTNVLLSFQRAELVANRSNETTAEADTAFLANINMASSVATFALQASGLGAFVAHMCGSRGTLALMPMVRLMGVMTLAYWHQTSNGEPPNLLLFLLLDECCRVMNMAVAKPVRESLWRGLSNEARYEAKPIVDTLANRWGGGSAAFLVSSINRLLDLFGVPEANNGEARVVMGFPPVLFLCMIVAVWWTGVSADLGQIRRRIDMELKKMQ